MFKNQLQELAQRSCLNLPSYSCVREGPDHAPKFKSTVTFNGEPFESPGFYNTLRQAEHAAAEVALITLSKRGPTQSLAAQILDETGACKNLLQETVQRAGASLPVYSIKRSGPGHMPVFVAAVQLAGMSFVGESAKTKKQAEKNAATAAWASLKQSVFQGGASSSSSSSLGSQATEEQMQMAIIRMLMNAAQKSMQGSPSSSGPSPTSRITITPLEETPGESSSTPQIRLTPLEEKPGRPSPTSRIRITPLKEKSGGPSPTPRIRITPFEEKRDQAAVNVPTSTDAKADNNCSPVTTRRIKIIPFEEQHGGETSNTPRASPRTPIGSKTHNLAQQEQDYGRTSQESCHNIVAEISTTASRMGSHNREQQNVQTLMIIHGTHSQVANKPLHYVQSNDNNLFRGGGASRVLIDGNDIGSSENNVSSLHSGSIHTVWTGEHMSTDAAKKPAASSAPHVRVRQAIPVFSTPPHISEVKGGGNDSTDIEALQGLGNLKL